MRLDAFQSVEQLELSISPMRGWRWWSRRTRERLMHRLETQGGNRFVTYDPKVIRAKKRSDIQGRLAWERQRQAEFVSGFWPLAMIYLLICLGRASFSFWPYICLYTEQEWVWGKSGYNAATVMRGSRLMEWVRKQRKREITSLHRLTRLNLTSAAIRMMIF